MPARHLPAVTESAAVSAFDYGNEGTYGIPSHPIDRPLAAVRRYKWLVFAVFALAAVGGFLATRLITPEYQVRATVWVQSPNSNGGDRTGPIRSAELLSSSPAWIELFRSYRIVDEVVRRLTLYLTPEVEADAHLFAGFSLRDRFLPGKYELLIDPAKRRWELRDQAGQLVERGAATDSVGARVGFQWRLPDSAFSGAERSVRFTVATPRETALRLLEHLEPRLAEGSNFLWLSYSDRNAQSAATTLNTWLDEYVRVAADLKKRNMVEFANILEGQLRFAEKATQDAETAYQSFRVNTITLPTEAGPIAAGASGSGAADRDPAVQSFFDQKIQYDNLRNDREALQKVLAGAASGATPYEGLLLIPSVAQSPGAEALREAFRSLYETQARLRVERQNYTDEYPTVKQLVASVDVLQRQTIPHLADRLLVQLREREMDYQRRIQGASRELQQIPPRTIEEMRLHRAVTVAEGLYTNLKNRYAEARLAEASASPDISVLDTAVAPQQPNKNKAGYFFLMSLAAGLAGAVALALLLDRLDRKFRYSEQAISELGLAIAGAVPRIPKRGISAANADQASQIVEAFRTLRMHVMHTLPPSRQTAVAVTSAAPGDGKSLVAANLALSFAEAGLRTILVDGDTRRGTLHRTFNQDAADGLTEYLMGTIDERRAVRATSHPSLWFISCGRRHARSPELLGTPRIKHLVDSLSRGYDVVIFDTPPLAAGIDAYAISAAAGSVLMVIRLGETERRLAAMKLAVLDRLPVELLGTVLNGVQLEGEFKYYAYSSGYALSASEQRAEDAAALKGD